MMAGVSKTGVDAAGGGVVGAHGAAGTSGPIGARRISARRDAAHVNHGLLHRGPVGIAMLAVAALMISSCARTASATHTHGESHLGASAVSSARGRVLPAPQAPGPRPKASELESVSCASTQSCVAVGIRAGGGALSFTTTDAGATWKQGALPRGAGALDSVQCMSSSRCVATGEGALLVSTDAGATWQTAADPVPSADLASVVCPTSQVCIAAGLYARATTGTAAVIIESADGGGDLASFAGAGVGAGCSEPWLRICGLLRRGRRRHARQLRRRGIMAGENRHRRGACRTVGAQL